MLRLTKYKRTQKLKTLELELELHLLVSSLLVYRVMDVS